MSALVDATTLRKELTARDDLLLLDVRWTIAGPDPTAYAAGHLPAAVFCNLDTDLAGPPGEGGRHPLPPAAAMTSALRRLGVAPGRPVVVYDDAGSQPAARAWWCLRWAGHEPVRVLDGGLAAWRNADGPLETGVVEPVPAPDAAARVGSLPTVSADEAAVAGVLIDVRAAERFRGEVEPIDPIAGHIPGAVSCPASTLCDESGRLLPRERLLAVLEPLLENGSRVVSYCGSGVTATQLVLALHELGVDAALYPGSWSEWIRDPRRPIATGA